MYFVNEENASSRFARNLSEGLQQLAQHKIKGMEKDNTIRALSSLGYTPEQSAGMANLPSEMLKPILSGLSAAKNKTNPMVNEKEVNFMMDRFNMPREKAMEFVSLDKNIKAHEYKKLGLDPNIDFGGDQGAPAPSTGPQTENLMNSAGKKEWSTPQLLDLFGSRAQSPQQPMAGAQPNQPMPAAQMATNQSPMAPSPVSAQAAVPSGMPQGAAEAVSAPEVIASVGEEESILSTKPKSYREVVKESAKELEAKGLKKKTAEEQRKEEAEVRKHERTMAHTDKKIEARDRQLDKKIDLDEKKLKQNADQFQEIKIDKAFDVNRELLKDLSIGKAVSKTALDSLRRMDKLAKSGKLETTGYLEGMKEAGFDIPALMGAEPEQFQQLASALLGKDDPSMQRLAGFIGKLPELSMSPEGRRLANATLRDAFMKIALKAKISDDILKDNKGIPPRDLRQQIDKELEEYYPQLDENLQKALDAPVPKAENKAKTVLKVLAGKTAGKSGDIISTAAKYYGGGKAIGLIAGQANKTARAEQPLSKTPRNDFVMSPFQQAQWERNLKF